jgi:hypothetical protein
MRGLSRVAAAGSFGIALFAFAMWSCMGQSLTQAAGKALMPFGLFASAAIYGSVYKRAPVAGALAVTLPLFVAIATLKQLLQPLPDGFSWSYAALLGAAVGAIWGCILPIVARFRTEASVGSVEHR